MEDFSQKQRLSMWLAQAVCVLWASWVLVDFLANHDRMVRAVTELPYAGLLLGFLLIGGAWSWLSAKRLKQAGGESYSQNYRGFWLLLAVQLLAGMILYAFSRQISLNEISFGLRFTYFFFFSGAFLLAILLLLSLAYVIGNLFLRKLEPLYPQSYRIVCIALGFSLIGFVAVILGQLGLLKQLVLWGLTIPLLAWQWRAGFSFLKSIVWTRRTAVIERSWQPLVFVILFAIIAINWIGAFKPFPIGYDGSGLYVNLAELVATKEALPAGGQAFNWSVIMGMAQIMFSSRIIAILLAHFTIVLCLFPLYRISRIWLTPVNALLVVLMTLSSPFISFQALVDEKIDFAFLYIILSTLLLLFGVFKLKSKQEEHPVKSLLFFNRWSLSPRLYVLLVVGWLSGFAFGIKYTAVFFLLALACWLCYIAGKRKAFFAGFLLTFGLVFLAGIYRFGYINLQPATALLLGGVFSLLGLIALAYTFNKDRGSFLTLLRWGSCLLLTFIISYAPWAVKHVSEHGHFSLGTVIEGRSDGIQILQRLRNPSGQNRQERDWQNRLTSNTPGQNQNTFKPQLTFQSDSEPVNTSQAAREEIQRYMGFEPVLWRYASLPTDMTNNVNVKGSRFVNIGFLFLLFFPLLFFITPAGRRPIWLSALLGVIGLCWLGLNHISIYAPSGNWDAAQVQAQLDNLLVNQSGWLASTLSAIHGLFAQGLNSLAQLLLPVYNWGSQLGVATVMIIIPSLFFLLSYLMKDRIKMLPLSFKAFSGFLTIYLVLWCTLGNSIIWYAMPAFVLLPIMIIWYRQYPAQFLGEQSRKFSRYFIGAGLSVFLLLNTLYYFTSSFPSDQKLEGLFRWPFVEYVSNPNMTLGRVYDAFNPVMQESVRIMNADPTAKIYRLNTHYGFHIENNDVRVYSDPVLERFDQVTRDLADPEEFINILKSQGFRYLFVDLRTYLADQTPEQSLKAKYIRFANMLLQSSQINVLTTDNYVADPNGKSIQLPDGTVTTASFGLRGTTVSLGNIALFEIR